MAEKIKRSIPWVIAAGTSIVAVLFFLILVVTFVVAVGIEADKQKLERNYTKAWRGIDEHFHRVVAVADASLRDPSFLSDKSSKDGAIWSTLLFLSRECPECTDLKEAADGDIPIVVEFKGDPFVSDYGKHFTYFAVVAVKKNQGPQSPCLIPKQVFYRRFVSDRDQKTLERFENLNDDRGEWSEGGLYHPYELNWATYTYAARRDIAIQVLARLGVKNIQGQGVELP